MSTYESAALWSATPLASDEKKLASTGLSVRQRKLLSLLTQPVTADQLAQNIALPVEEIHHALERFAKLGLATTDASSGDPMQLRMQRASSGTGSSKTPLFVGIGAAALAAVAVVWWLMSGSSAPKSSAPTPATQPGAAPQAAAPRAPAATGSLDSADIALP